MYTNKTYQDYEQANDKPAFIMQAVIDYKNSYFYKTACTAERYFNGNNDILTKKRKTIMKKYEYTNQETGELERTASEYEYQNNKISSSYIMRFVLQAVQYLLNNGLQTDMDKQAIFGTDIDMLLQKAVEKAQLHGETVLFWNNNKLEQLNTASINNLNGMFFLLDEETSQLRIGIRFWQLKAEKPMYIEEYTPEGIRVYRVEKNANKPIEIEFKPYIKKITKSIIGETIEDIKLGYLPFAMLKANDYSNSILSENIKTKIDLYDVILSDFGDNMERLEGIYWAIKNFGGTSEQAKCMLADIERYKMAVSQDDMSASPQSIEAPFNARKFALDILERALYKDCLALNMDEITGGSLTNIAIYTAKANLDTKCNMIEYQIFDTLKQISVYMKQPELVSHINNFQRMEIANKSEIVQDIYIMRADITRKKALELNPYIDRDEIEELLNDMDAEDMSIDE